MNVIWTILQNGVAVAIVEMTKVQNVIPDTDSQLLRYAKLGAIWTASDELLAGFQNKNSSNLFNGNYMGVIDELFLNSVLVAGTEKLGVIESVMDITDKLPFGEKLNNVVATGVVKFGSRVAIEYLPLDGVPYLQYLKHVTGLIQ